MHALFPDRLADDIDEEFRDHLERRTSDLMASGLSEHDARRQARAAFGNVTAIAERSRDVRLSTTIEGTIQDVRYAVRGLRTHRAVAATAVLSLGLAIGSITAIFTVVDAAMLRPLPIPGWDRIVTLAKSDSGPAADAGDELFNYPLYLELKRAAAGVAQLAMFRPAGRVEAQVGDASAPVERVTLQHVSGDAFEMLRLTPSAGQLFSSEDDHLPGARNVVLSDGYWARRFNRSAAVVGQLIVLDGRAAHVIGVAPPVFAGVEPGTPVDLWLPATAFDPGVFTNPDANWFRIMGRLTGASRGELEARLEPVFAQEQMDRALRHSTSGQNRPAPSRLSVAAGAGRSEFRRAYARPLWTLFAVACCLLLIAATNVAGLLLARAVARAPEMALRASIGGSRARLLRQLLVEGLVLAALAGVAGWVLAQVGAPLLLQLLATPQGPAGLDVTADRRVLAFCIAVCGLSTVIFALLPAWHTSAATPVHLLRAQSPLRSSRAGRAFVGAQLAFAFCLVVIGAAFVASLRNLHAVPIGFDPRGVTAVTLAVDTGTARAGLDLTRELQSRVAAMPRVDAAAAAWWPLMDGQQRRDAVVIPGALPANRSEIFARISPGYFRTLRIPLSDGREFDVRDDETGPTVPTIVNLAFARRYFGTASVVGRRFGRADGAVHQIVGVSGDTAYTDVRTGVEPIAYFPMKPPRQFVLYVRSTDEAIVVSQRVQAAAAGLGHGAHVVEARPLQSLIDRTVQREWTLASVGALFGGLGLALAAMGLFGLLTYTVVRRTPELGLRAALGARRTAVVRLVLGDVAVVVGVGLALGWAGALVLLRITHSLLFQVQVADPRVLVAATVLFAVAAFAAAAVPALRAAAIDPLIALKRD